MLSITMYEFIFGIKILNYIIFGVKAALTQSVTYLNIKSNIFSLKSKHIFRRSHFFPVLNWLRTTNICLIKQF